MPTATQADAAKRLSQGLSVTARSSSNRTRPNGMMIDPSALQYSVVLDPQEYSSNHNPFLSQLSLQQQQYQQQFQQQQQQSAGPFGVIAPELAWPSTKANRCSNMAIGRMPSLSPGSF